MIEEWTKKEIEEQRQINMTIPKEWGYCPECGDLLNIDSGLCECQDGL